MDRCGGSNRCRYDKSGSTLPDVAVSGGIADDVSGGYRPFYEGRGSPDRTHQLHKRHDGPGYDILEAVAFGLRNGLSWDEAWSQSTPRKLAALKEVWMRMDLGNRAQSLIDMRVTEAKSEVVEKH